MANARTNTILLSWTGCCGVDRPHSTSHAECTTEQATVDWPSAGGTATTGTGQRGQAALPRAPDSWGRCNWRCRRMTDRQDVESSTAGFDMPLEVLPSDTGRELLRRWGNDSWADGVRGGGGLVSSGGG